jgi:hypothetical protein
MALMAAMGSASAWANDTYFVADETAAAAISQPADMPMVAADPGMAMDAVVEEEEEDTAPARLFAQSEDGWNFTGWIAQGVTGNIDSPNDRFNGPSTWMDRSNDYQMTETWLSFAKKTDASSCDWSVGGRIDAFYGSSYRWCTSAGLESTWNTGQFYGLALPSAYAEIARNGVTTKIGHFISPVGFYTVGTANNFFNYIPYTYQYGEPFTHTGILSQWQATDDLNVGAGITNGWDSTANYDPTGTALGNAGVTNPWNRHAGLLMTATRANIAKEGDSLAWVGTYGLEPDITLANRTPRYFQTVVYSRPVNECVQYILQSDFGTQSRAIGAQSAQWYGINQYLYVKRSNITSWGGNFEWFRDDDGFRVGQVLPSFGSPNGRGFARGPFEGDFFRIGIGPRYTPNNNVIIRPTMIFDWYSGNGAPNGARPFDDGTKNTQLLFNIDLVVLF